MLYFVIKVAICSAIFIFVVHQIIDYLKETLTVPKTIDLVNVTEKKYEAIQKTLNKLTSQSTTTKINQLKPSISTPPSQKIPPFFPDDSSSSLISSSSSFVNDFAFSPTMSSSTTSMNMKNELKNFLKQSSSLISS